jgi:hypothetical protein
MRTRSPVDAIVISRHRGRSRRSLARASMRVRSRSTASASSLMTVIYEIRRDRSAAHSREPFEVEGVRLPVARMREEFHRVPRVGMDCKEPMRRHSSELEPVVPIASIVSMREHIVTQKHRPPSTLAGPSRSSRRPLLQRRMLQLRSMPTRLRSVRIVAVFLVVSHLLRTMAAQQSARH